MLNQNEVTIVNNVNTVNVITTKQQLEVKQQLKLDKQLQLIKGLIQVVNDVKGDVDCISYDMDSYYMCILGATYKTTRDTYKGKLKELFNIEVKSLDENSYTYGLNKQEKRVINLFTTNVTEDCDNLISKEDWLTKANKVLFELGVKYTCMYYKYHIKALKGVDDVVYNKYKDVHKNIKVNADKYADDCDRFKYTWIIVDISMMFLFDEAPEGYLYWRDVCEFSISKQPQEIQGDLSKLLYGISK